jgi:hypothetical protein
MKVIAFFLTISLVQFSGCTTKGAKQMSELNETSDARTIVAQYVASHKGWRPSQYRIEQDKKENGLMVFTVVYLDDERKSIPGGGKSFEVYYDPIKRKIVEELGFQ